MRSVVVSLLLVGACGDDGKGSTPPPGAGSLYSTEVKEGIATYYDATGAGNCGFDATPGDLDVAAFDANSYAGSAACGACVKVKGPNGEVTVRIVDSCPGCDANHLDLSRSAFAKIAEPSRGRVPVSFSTVACSVSGAMTYHFKEGSSKWWTAIQVRNHRIPVAKVEYEKAGTFVEMKRLDYNFFVEDGGVGDQPNGLALRVTAADGQVVLDNLPGEVPSNATVAGSKNFN
jgi:expansin (peptidoglycan-binding protein)